MKPNILVVEDEEHLKEALKLNLELEGYEVTATESGIDALKHLQQEHFDLLLLDIMLPELDGISVLENVKLKYPTLPVLILSAKNNSNDRVLGLKKGADDYLTKPFNLEELLLRVANLIKKSQKISGKKTVDDVFTFGNNTIDFKASQARNFNGEIIDLTKKELQLLKLLIEHKNEVVPREKILQIVWGYNVYPTTRTIDNFILNFRKYFEADTRNPTYFFSVRGVGYKFSEGL